MNDRQKHFAELLQFLNKITEMVSGADDIKRKNLITHAFEGWEKPENWLYPVLLPENRGTGRGLYSLSKMAAFASSQLPEGETTEETQTPAPVKKTKKAAPVEPEPEVEVEDSEVEINWAPLEPTDDDIADELASMGTYM